MSETDSNTSSDVSNTAVQVEPEALGLPTVILAKVETEEDSHPGGCTCSQPDTHQEELTQTDISSTSEPEHARQQVKML